MNGVDYLRNLHITPDLTPAEREQNKAKLKEMNQQGNRYRIKKRSDCAEGETGSLSTASKLSFKCLYTNAQSICNKFDEFKSCIFHHHSKIIAITESWCNEAVS